MPYICPVSTLVPLSCHDPADMSLLSKRTTTQLWCKMDEMDGQGSRWAMMSYLEAT